MHNPENTAADYHRIPLTELEQRLNCNSAGLDSDEAARRLKNVGNNDTNTTG